VRCDSADPRVGLTELPDEVQRPVAARVVDDEQFVVDRLTPERVGEARERLGDRAALVVSRNDGAELQTATLQLSTFRS
jgi:hypothetical protein